MFRKKSGQGLCSNDGIIQDIPKQRPRKNPRPFYPVKQSSHPVGRDYLRILRNRSIFTGTCFKDMGVGAAITEITDKILRKALVTRSLKFDMPVSFLIIPDIHSTSRADKKPVAGLQISGSQFEFPSFITRSSHKYDMVR